MPEIRAKYLITATDDFIVEVFWNGVLVPTEQRKLLAEIHGAIVERIDREVRAGDWIVFNVVNNRLRWDGMYYFGLAGCLEENRFGFVSNLDDGRWWACDRPLSAEAFIAGRRANCFQPVVKPSTVWNLGDGLMRQYAGSDWKGVPIWGRARNTWIKVLVD